MAKGGAAGCAVLPALALLVAAVVSAGGVDMAAAAAPKQPVRQQLHPTAGSRQQAWHEIHRAQIAAFRAGTGTNILHHITHHGGTALWHIASKNGFAGPERNMERKDIALSHCRADVISKAFANIPHRWIGIEAALLPQCERHYPWRDPNFIFATVTRPPLWRTLAREAITTRKYPEVYDRVFERFLTDPASQYLRDNYMLRWLAGNPCAVTDWGCQRSGNVTHVHLLRAMEMLERFAFVLVIDDNNPAWFNLTVTSMCRELGWTDCSFAQAVHPRPTLRHLINNDRLFLDVLEIMRLDNQLYEYSKTLAYDQLLYYGHCSDEELAELLVPTSQTHTIPPDKYSGPQGSI